MKKTAEHVKSIKFWVIGQRYHFKAIIRSLFRGLLLIDDCLTSNYAPTFHNSFFRNNRRKKRQQKCKNPTKKAQKRRPKEESKTHSLKKQIGSAGRICEFQFGLIGCRVRPGGVALELCRFGKGH